MSIKINRLEEGHNSYPLVCRRPAETVPSKGNKYVIDEELQHTDHLFLGVACFTFLNCVWTNMWNCSLIQHVLSHRFYDWKLCEWFLLSGFLICHAVGRYTGLKNPKIFRVFQNPHVIYATMRVNSFTIFLFSIFYCRHNLCQNHHVFNIFTAYRVE